jgi:hypothetical protein
MAAPSRDHVISDIDPTSYVYVDESGPGCPLVCSKHNSMKCSDVIEVMKKNLDAERLWAKEVLRSREFIIQVMPSQSISIMVALFEEDNDDRYVKMLKWKHPGPNWQDRDYEFLGFLSNGEGRGSIRQLIINELDAILVDKICNAKTHGISAQREWKLKMGESHLSSWLERYHTLINGMCTYCNFSQRTALGSGDDSDLIPDATESNARSIWNASSIPDPKEHRKLRRPRPGKLPDKDFRPNFAPSPKDSKTDDLLNP